LLRTPRRPANQDEEEVLGGNDKKAIYRPGTLPECQVIKKRLSKKIEQARDVAVASSSEN
jgi:hypothetical protein